jgi:methylmalonyl-CoA mutase cobalamin-binding subunit
MRALQEQGVGRLFGPGTTTTDAVEYIPRLVSPSTGATARFALYE